MYCVAIPLGIIDNGFVRIDLCFFYCLFRVTEANALLFAH